MRRDQISKTDENLIAHLFVPSQRTLARETTVTNTEIKWRIEIEQRSLYVFHQCIKFHLIPFYTFRDMLQTSFLLQKLKREVTL